MSTWCSRCIRLWAVSLFSWSVKRNVQAKKMTTRMIGASFLKFPSFATWPSGVRALPSLNLKKKRLLAVYRCIGNKKFVCTYMSMVNHKLKPLLEKNNNYRKSDKPQSRLALRTLKAGLVEHLLVSRKSLHWINSLATRIALLLLWSSPAANSLFTWCQHNH